MAFSRTKDIVIADNLTRRASLLVWGSLVTIALGVVGLILAAPILKAAGQSQLAATIYTTFSYVCHQIPERSFHLAHYKFGVCSRCTGLYSGIALAALAYPLVRPVGQTITPRIIWLILAAIPIAVDFSLGYFNIWPNTHLSRFVTGAILGSTTVFYILPGLIELSSILSRSGRTHNYPTTN